MPWFQCSSGTCTRVYWLRAITSRLAQSPYHSNESMVESHPEAVQLEKAKLRRSLLQTRQAMSREAWQSKSTQLCQQLAALSVFKQARTVLAYFSVRQEPDLSLLFQIEKTWGFPRCVHQSLVWHQWCPHSPYPLQKGTFGIWEPHPDAPTLNASEIDFMLVPAVACDRQGYRLGYGGGFYDRLLSSPAWSAIPTIGIVFEVALFPHLPHAEWDRSLTAVCTELNVWNCPPAQ